MPEPSRFVDTEDDVDDFWDITLPESDDSPKEESSETQQFAHDVDTLADAIIRQGSAAAMRRNAAMVREVRSAVKKKRES